MRRIRRWYAEQWAEPEDGEPVCIDGTLPPDAGMSTVEYAVGTGYVHPRPSQRFAAPKT